MKTDREHPAGGLSRALVVLFTLHAIVALAAAWSGVREIGLLERSRDGEEITGVEAESVDALSAAVGLIQTGLMVLTAATFVMWTHRVCRHAAWLSGRALQRSAGWVAGSFFVPFANLVIPYLGLKEAAVASGGASRSGDGHGLLRLMPWWWTAWVVSNALGGVAARMMMRDDDVAGVLRSTWVMLGSDLLEVPAAILALSVVRGLTGLQTRRLSAGGAVAEVFA